MKIFLDYFDALRAENVDLLAHLLNQLTNIAGLSNVHITLFSNSYYTPFIFNISPILCFIVPAKESYLDKKFSSLSPPLSDENMTLTLLTICPKIAGIGFPWVLPTRYLKV